MFQSDTPPEALIETLSVLSILITRFAAFLSDAGLKPPPLETLSPLLSHPRPAVRKRAIVTLAQFLPVSQAQLFSGLLGSTILPGLAPSASIDQQRTVVQLVTAVARHSPQQIAPVLGDIVPSVLKAVQRDDEELREGSLQVLRIIYSSLYGSDPSD